MPMVTVPLEPAATVSCATVMSPSLGPRSGTIQKTAPAVVVSGRVAVHWSKGIPTAPRLPLASPSVMPTVSHES